MIGIIERHLGNKCQPARSVASNPLLFFCPALATHQLGMTSDPHAICQSSNRHLRRILDQAAATFFAQRCWHFTFTHGFGHKTLVQQHALWTQLQLQQWARLQHFFGRNFLPYVLGSSRAQTCASFWNSDVSPHLNVHQKNM